MNYYIVNKVTREWTNHISWDGKPPSPNVPEGYELVPDAEYLNPVREVSVDEAKAKEEQAIKQAAHAEKLGLFGATSEGSRDGQLESICLFVSLIDKALLAQGLSKQGLSEEEQALQDELRAKWATVREINEKAAADLAAL